MTHKKHFVQRCARAREVHNILRETDKEDKKMAAKEDTKKNVTPEEEKNVQVSDTWAEETIADLDDFIESQGIYIRQ